jgi:hypothetical protein
VSLFAQTETLFHQALALPTGEDCVPWLQSRCGEDVELFQEVLSLLEAQAEMKRLAIL